MAKMPFMKFFPRDWMGDDKLRLCSIAARGLWIEMLCLMHSAPRRGYLQTATGTPLPLEQIARMAGCPTDEASRLLQELIDSGVCDCSEHGLIYSRRMVREAGVSLTRSANGAKGAVSTNIKKQGISEFCRGKTVGKTPANESANDPAKVRPSEAQRLRGSEEEEKRAPPGGEAEPPPETPLPPTLDTPEFRGAWARWLDDRRKRKLKKLTADGERTQLNKLAAIGSSKAIECIELSIANGWQGLFPDRFKGSARGGFQTHDDRWGEMMFGDGPQPGEAA